MRKPAAPYWIPPPATQTNYHRLIIWLINMKKSQGHRLLCLKAETTYPRKLKLNWAACLCSDQVQNGSFVSLAYSNTNQPSGGGMCAPNLGLTVCCHSAVQTTTDSNSASSLSQAGLIYIVLRAGRISCKSENPEWTIPSSITSPLSRIMICHTLGLSRGKAAGHSFMIEYPCDPWGWD